MKLYNGYSMYQRMTSVVYCFNKEYSQINSLGHLVEVVKLEPAAASRSCKCGFQLLSLTTHPVGWGDPNLRSGS
jgi:hypothetical protein